MYLQLLSLIFSLPSVILAADFRLANHYADHMVLQRGPKSSIIWGFGESNAPVIVSIADKIYRTRVTTDSRGFNTWRVVLDPIFAKGPYQIDAESTVAGVEMKKTLRDVLFGDVWLCGGQSNMQFTTSMAFKGKEEIARAAHYPNIRLFTVERFGSPTRMVELNTRNILQQWSVASETSVGGRDWLYFSAVCWMFGRRLYDIYKVPIGLISSNYYGTVIEAWSSPSTLAKCETPLYRPREPSTLWNGMIAPLLNSTIHGVIWFQGESNAYRPDLHPYECTFPALIEGWRREWYEATSGHTDAHFPFGFVQLSPLSMHDGVVDFASIRWKQTAEYGYVPNPKQVNTFMAVTMDLIDDSCPYGSIHPRDKTSVAERLVKGAKSIAYGVNVPWMGPIVESIELTDNRQSKTNSANGSLDITIRYRSTAGIEVRTSRGFEVTLRNETSKWIPVNITSSSGNSLMLTLKGVPKELLTGLRYGWSQRPCAYKLCAVYELESDLPSPPFIAHAPFLKGNK